MRLVERTAVGSCAEAKRVLTESLAKIGGGPVTDGWTSDWIFLSLLQGEVVSQIRPWDGESLMEAFKRSTVSIGTETEMTSDVSWRRNAGQQCPWGLGPDGVFLRSPAWQARRAFTPTRSRASTSDGGSAP